MIFALGWFEVLNLLFEPFLSVLLVEHLHSLNVICALSAQCCPVLMPKVQSTVQSGLKKPVSRTGISHRLLGLTLTHYQSVWGPFLLIWLHYSYLQPQIEPANMGTVCTGAVRGSHPACVLTADMLHYVMVACCLTGRKVRTLQDSLELWQYSRTERYNLALYK